MTTVVLDTNTVVSAIFWPQSTARRCLAGLARRWYALAASARLMVSRDHDLLKLGKPFGIEIITPARFLAWLRQNRRSISSLK